jgi:hypothetical protein
VSLWWLPLNSPGYNDLSALYGVKDVANQADVQEAFPHTGYMLMGNDEKFIGYICDFSHL